MEFVLFAVVAGVAAVFCLWYLFAFAASRVFDWLMSPFVPSMRARRAARCAEGERVKRERWEEFRARVQPTYEAHRRPSHDAQSMREYRRLLRVEVREARERAKKRRG